MNIIDFRAVVKHAYYGADKSEGIHCEKTDRKFPLWQTGASGVLTRVVRSIIESGDSPRTLIVVHDMGQEYRKGLFAGYKGQKEKKAENKSPVEMEQIEELYAWAKKFFAAIGATQIGVKGVEADDVIAWICERVPGAKTVWTVDADLLQLVNGETAVYLKGEPHFDVGSHKDIPYSLTSIAKSMLGDSADNYGGVPGAGPAFFARLLEKYDVDGIEELRTIVDRGDTGRLDQVIAETQDKDLIKLRDNFADWRLGWKLAQLRPDLCWKPRRKKLTTPLIHKRIPNAQATYDLLRAIGCGDMWEEYAGLMPSPMPITADNWDDMKAAVYAELKLSDTVSFDYEGFDKNNIKEFRLASTKGNGFVDMLSQQITGCSFQFGKHLENVIYISVEHKDAANLPMQVVKDILEYCQAHDIQLVAHNAGFEGVVTKTNMGLNLQRVMDTRIMKRYYDENTEAGLKFCSMEYLGYKQTTYQEVTQGRQMNELTLDEVFDYGADDALVTGLLFDLLKLLLQLDGQWDFYARWGVRSTEVLQRAYVDGVNINWALQRRIHERDLDIIEQGMIDLRHVLEKNVTGNITEGCKSLIEAERDFVYRSAKRKAEGDTGPAGEAVAAWRKKLEAACQYIPYRVEKVMPSFAFTPKQVNAALVEIGLPELEKFTKGAIEEYLEKVGAVGFEDDWELKEGDQRTLIKSLNKAFYLGVDKMGDLRKKSDADPENQSALQAYETAAAFKEELGELVQRLAKVEAREVEFGDQLNVGSPQQMQQLLYCKIGVPVRLRGKAPGKSRKAIGITEAGPATDVKAIETAIANDIEPGSWQAEALKVLGRVKSATTRCSLYHDKLPLWRHVDGKVHPVVTDFGTDTGRPTASAPNVLAVSKKDKEMRSMYIPPNQDYVCVAIDYNGQEIRLMANLANDPVMMSVYDPANEKDLHSMTGSGIAKMDYTEFKAAIDDEHHPKSKLAKDIRKQAKGVNFGMAYGAGPGTLSRNLIVKVEVAKKLLDDTFDLYTRIRPWQEETAEFMNRNGFTLTAFGTKRHATADIFSDDNGKVSRQHRQGTNATIQKTAAEMLRKVLTRVAESGMLDELRMSFFAPIYDEVVSWVHKDDVLEYCRVMGRFMEESTPENHLVRQVPEYSIGPDWGRVHELGRDISPDNVAKFVARALEEAKEIWEVDVLQPFNPIRTRFIVETDEDGEELNDEMAA